jgi:hypothetical protein
MIPLAAIPIIAGGAQALIGGIGAALQKRPEYKIPDAVNQQLGYAAYNASSGLPSYGNALNQIDANTANALSAARESGNPMAAISAIQANQNAGTNDLNVNDANYRASQQQQLQQALAQKAQYDDQAWQINEYAPYADKRKLFENMFGAGVKNMMGGLDNMASMDAMKQLMPTTQPTQGATMPTLPRNVPETGFLQPRPFNQSPIQSIGGQLPTRPLMPISFNNLPTLPKFK